MSRPCRPCADRSTLASLLAPPPSMALSLALSLAPSMALSLALLLGLPPGAWGLSAQVGPPRADASGIPEGWQRAPWAAVGLLRNPVAIAFDPWGRLYVSETDRASNAVEDTRQIGHLNAVLEDLRLQSVEDRGRLIDRWLAAGAFEPDFFTRTEERVRRVEDRDGDGKAETSSVFAGGFNAPLDGIASGVLWHDGALFFTNIPHLWKLSDADEDGQAETRESLSYGYGVRWCFYGHDLHGPSIGPDGRLYFSMGDRGFHVVTQEGQVLHHPDTGAVLRCWPDGRSLEVFHLGLRNPQELCWNDEGDLFTGDNNCDSGDQARLVHVIDGADSGWCQDVQSLPSRGPWNREHLWELSRDFPGLERPLWCLSPVAHVGAGPSGFEAYPGIGGGAGLAGRLLLVDFRGSESLVHALLPEPTGAAFNLAEDEIFFRGATVTDLAFGYDGRLYFSDWGGGWSPNPNGNVFTLTPPASDLGEAEQSSLAGVQALCQGGVQDLDLPGLLKLFAHGDRRARFAAQFEVLRRAPKTSPELEALAADPAAPRLARLHALWTIGGLAREQASWLSPLAARLQAADPLLRARAAQALANLFDAPTRAAAQQLAPALIERLGDSDPRAVREAALALGRLDVQSAGSALLAAAARLGHAFGSQPAEDQPRDRRSDEVLLGSIAVALERLGPAGLSTAQIESLPLGARLALTLALARSGSPALGDLLDDPEPRVAVEAFRAIYDRTFQHPELRALWPRLAERLDAPLPQDWPAEPILRRAIEAAQALGGADQARRLLAFAARPDSAGSWRALALERLEEFGQPQAREGVWGHLVEPPTRSTEPVATAVASLGEQLLSSAAEDPEALGRARTLLVRYGPARTPTELVAGLGDLSQPPAARAVMFEQLLAKAPERLVPAVGAVLKALPMEGDQWLRRRALEALLAQDPSRAERAAKEQLFAARAGDRQNALWVLAELGTPSAQATIQALSEPLAQGGGDRTLALELFLLGTRADWAQPGTPSPTSESTAHGRLDIAQRPMAVPLDTLLSGGSPERGRELFLHHEAAECLRCHRLDGQGGIVGPALDGIGARLSTRTLAESLVTPDARIAPGYQSPSAMPNLAALIGPSELRDLVAFLSSTGSRNPVPATQLAASHESGPQLPTPRVLGATGLLCLLLGGATALLGRGRS